MICGAMAQELVSVVSKLCEVTNVRGSGNNYSELARPLCKSIYI